MSHSLKNQLTFPVILAFLLLGFSAFWIVESQIRDRLVAEFDQSLLARANLLMKVTAFEEADAEDGELEPFLEFEFESEFMPEFGDNQGAYFQLWHDDEEFARSGSLAEGELPRIQTQMGESAIENAILPDGLAGRILTWRFRPYLDEEWGEESLERANAVGERYPGLEIPSMTLSVGVSREKLNDTLEYIALILGASMAALMVIVGGLVRYSVTRGLKPLNNLVGQLDGINSEKLDSRLSEDGLPEEVAPLAGTMNSLLDRLDQSFQKERQFSRNIAHELRTPIAELRSIGEVGEQWHDDPATNQQFFGDIRQIGNRMDLMVTNLLTMARQESGQIECAWENLNLNNTLMGVQNRFNAECKESGIQMSMRARAPVQVMADRVYLDIIATNLLSNAIHHGRGDVSIQVYSDGGRAGFAVENPAISLTDDDLPFLFDRFWRKDTARTSGRHAGLGLSLVKSLSEVCDWSVRAELTRERRFRIQVDGMRHS